MLAAQQGPDALFCMPKRTRRITLVSKGKALFSRRPPRTSLLVLSCISLSNMRAKTGDPAARTTRCARKRAPPRATIVTSLREAALKKAPMPGKPAVAVAALVAKIWRSTVSNAVSGFLLGRRARNLEVQGSRLGPEIVVLCC
jgi:hypothetical protein